MPVLPSCRGGLVADDMVGSPLTVLAVNYLGAGLRDALAPRIRGR